MCAALPGLAPRALPCPEPARALHDGCGGKQEHRCPAAVLAHVNHSNKPGMPRAQVEIGNMDISLKYFEEVYTTEHWMVRIYRVLDKCAAALQLLRRAPSKFWEPRDPPCPLAGWRQTLCSQAHSAWDAPPCVHSAA